MFGAPTVPTHLRVLFQMYSSELIFFAISYGSEVISGNLSKSAFFKSVGHFERKFQTEGGVDH